MAGEKPAHRFPMTVRRNLITEKVSQTKRLEPKPKTEREWMLVAADADANRFNLKCMSLLAFLSALSFLLEELGLFSVQPEIMLVSALTGLVLFSLPVVLYLIHDKLSGRSDSILEHAGFQYVIIGFAYAGTALFCVTLSFHTVLLLALPPLLAAQYHDRDRLFFWTLILTILLVPVSVYGSFFFGAVDRNLLKGMVSDETVMQPLDRLALATPKRMLELFLHYVIPRLFGVIAIVLLADGVVRRNKKMLDRQEALSRRVQEDMEHITEMQSNVINALATIIENRDTGTGEHVIRTKHYVRMVAQALSKEEDFCDSLSPEEIEWIAAAAPLHDVGKITVSDTILLKPAKLTQEEFESIKTHTTKGKEMIRKVFCDLDDEKFLKTAEDIAVGHHEKWDGSGYPRGLKGEEIPLSARIMAVADVFDALSSVRVYKDAIPPQMAIDVMMGESGTHFDPRIMRVVWKIRDEIIAYAQSPLAAAESQRS